MRDIIIYVLEVMVCSGVLLTLYRLCLERRVAFLICRMTLLLSLVISCVIPLLDIPVWEGETIYVEPKESVAMTAPPAPIYIKEDFVITDAVAESAPRRIEAEDVCWAIYLLGVAVLLGGVLCQLYKIWRLNRGGVVVQESAPRIVRTKENISSFSFFGTIYINAQSECDATIVAHECSHIRHRHSLERLLMELLRSLLWWNPFVWVGRRLLAEVHEYEADSDVIATGYDKTIYMKSILESVIGYSPEVANGLRDSLTKKRFQMITSNSKSRYALLRVLALLPIVALLLCTFSFSAKATQYIEQEVQAEEGENINYYFTVVDSHNNPIANARILCRESKKVLYTNRDGHAILQKNISEPFDIEKDGYNLSTSMLKHIGEDGYNELAVLFKYPDFYYDKLKAAANQKKDASKMGKNTLNVIVWDDDGQPLEGVTIKQKDNDKNCTTTDKNGRAKINCTAKDLVVEKESYLTYNVSGVSDEVLCLLVKSPLHGKEQAVEKSMAWAKSTQEKLKGETKHNIYASVIDSDGNPIADVTLVGTTSGISAVTDKDGKTLFENSLDHDFRAIKEGYSQSKIRLETMADGKSISATAVMYKDPNHKSKQESKNSKSDIAIPEHTQVQKDSLLAAYKRAREAKAEWEINIVDADNKPMEGVVIKDYESGEQTITDKHGNATITGKLAHIRAEKEGYDAPFSSQQGNHLKIRMEKDPLTPVKDIEEKSEKYSGDIYYATDNRFSKAPTLDGKSVNEVQKLVRESVKMPKGSIKLGNVGSCSVSAIIETDGTLSSYKDVVFVDEYMSKELKRVIQSLKGKWQPAEVNGKKVRSLIIFLVDFYQDFSDELPKTINEEPVTVFPPLGFELEPAKYNGGDIEGLHAWVKENYKPYGELEGKDFRGEVDIVYNISAEGKISLHSVYKSIWVNILADQIVEFMQSAPGKISPAKRDGKPYSTTHRLKFDVVAKGEPQIITEELATRVITNPTFQGGGKNRFRDYLQQNLRYPEEALKQGITGRVMASFNIRSKDNVEIINNGPYNKMFADEVKRVIMSSVEYWQNGKSSDGKSDVRPYGVVFVDFCIEQNGKTYCKIDEYFKNLNVSPSDYRIAPVAVVGKLESDGSVMADKQRKNKQ